MTSNGKGQDIRGAEAGADFRSSTTPGRGRSTAKRTESRLDSKRVDAVRRRIAEGAYDAMPVVEEVARRILKRGDL